MLSSFFLLLCLQLLYLLALLAQLVYRTHNALFIVGQRHVLHRLSIDFLLRFSKLLKDVKLHRRRQLTVLAFLNQRFCLFAEILRVKAAVVYALPKLPHMCFHCCIKAAAILFQFGRIFLYAHAQSLTNGRRAQVRIIIDMLLDNEYRLCLQLLAVLCFFLGKELLLLLPVIFLYVLQRNLEHLLLGFSLGAFHHTHIYLLSIALQILHAASISEAVYALLAHSNINFFLASNHAVHYGANFFTRSAANLDESLVDCTQPFLKAAENRFDGLRRSLALAQIIFKATCKTFLCPLQLQLLQSNLLAIKHKIAVLRSISNLLIHLAELALQRRALILFVKGFRPPACPLAQCLHIIEQLLRSIRQLRQLKHIMQINVRHFMHKG